MTGRSRGSRMWPIVSAVALALAFAVFVGGILYTVHDRQNTDETVCKAIVLTRNAHRSTWLRIQALLTTPDMSAAERASLNDFIDSVLEEIPELECVNHKPQEVGT